MISPSDLVTLILIVIAIVAIGVGVGFLLGWVINRTLEGIHTYRKHFTK